MASITKLTPQKKPGRFNVFIDGKYAFAVSESTLIHFRLTKGLVIDDALQAKIAAQEVVAQANQLALTYLSHQQRTEHELRTKLAEADLPKTAIDAAVAHMHSLHYLDDAQFATAFINDDLHLKDKGPTVVAAKLKQHGIAESVIQTAVQAVADTDWLVPAQKAAKKAAAQTSRQPFYMRQQKIRQTLMKKGFDQAVAEAVLADLALVADPDSENERLRAAAAKLWRQKRQYQGYERQQRVKQALYRKGYDLDAIDTVLAELAEE
ncbi:recombination regulator RecX [Lacticaseibacillus sp. GG6-2]